MSNRAKAEKVEFVCINGHMLRQRADKPAPKICNTWIYSNGTRTACTAKPFSKAEVDAQNDEPALILEEEKPKRKSRKKVA